MCMTAAGCFVLGIGIGICNFAGLGTDALTVFEAGLQNKIGGTLGIMNLAVCLVMIVFGYFVDKSMISAVTFAAMIMTSLGIDAVGFVLPGRLTSIGLGLAVLAAGEILYALGCAIAIVPGAGYDPYNAFLMGLKKLTGKSYKVVRWSAEIIFIAVGWLLGGIVGIGTVLCSIVTGPLVELCARQLRNVLKAD